VILLHQWLVIISIDVLFVLYWRTRRDMLNAITNSLEILNIQNFVTPSDANAACTWCISVPHITIIGKRRNEVYPTALSWPVRHREAQPHLRIIVVLKTWNVQDARLSTLLMLPCVSSDACPLETELFWLLLLADRLAASICCFVCWCMVRAYDESVYVDSASISDADRRCEVEE
jgi:hypothetical protein